MRRILALLLVAAIVSLGLPLPLQALNAQDQSGVISGAVKDSAGRPVADRCVRLRDFTTKQIVDTKRTNDVGEYAFTGLAPGIYVVEVLDNDCEDPVAAIPPIGLTPAAMSVTGAVITIGAAGGPLAFLGSTAGILLLAGLGAGLTAAVVATRGTASPSR